MKPTYQEAKKITDSKYNLKDRCEISIDAEIKKVHDKHKKITEEFIKENKAKITESDELSGIGE